MTQAPSSWSAELDRHLAGLLAGGDADLAGGAELEVRHPEGSRAFRAPLARHHRTEHPQLVWIRPVVGGFTPDREPGAPAYAFDLGLARRRALEFTTAHRDGDALRFELVTGQTATIRPARPDTLAELERWDTYFLTVLDAATQRELDALAHDP